MSVNVMWYDDLDRTTGAAAFGIPATDPFALPSSPPSTGELLTTTAYTDDGTVLETTDPRGRKRRDLHDAMGRTVATISNYVDGTPSSRPATTTPSSGRRTRTGSGRSTGSTSTATASRTRTDQVTTYTYGVSKGTSAGDSKIAAGNLLQKVTYPDSSGGSDVVTYAYDTGRAPIWRKDQVGNVVETSYDSGGRRQHERERARERHRRGRRADHLRVHAHGRLETVTTYDDPSPGSGNAVNQVQSAWDKLGQPDDLHGRSGRRRGRRAACRRSR